MTTPDPVRPISDATLRGLRRANTRALLRKIDALGADIATVWTALETCECPGWAVGPHEATTAAFERIVTELNSREISDGT